MRIFVEPEALVAGELVVRGDEHHYLSHVRRARVGDSIELVDGQGRRAAATITRITDDATTLAVAAPEMIPQLPPRVRALVPLIKGDRMDACLEKLVEVGVDEIVVWPAARSVVRIDREKMYARRTKYRAAVQAAARQSGRTRVPDVELVDDLEEAIANLDGTRIVLDPTCTELIDEKMVTPVSQAVTIVSGPEGGFTSEELERLAAAGFVSAGLGPRVLRAETAPIVAVALIRNLTRS